MFGSLPKNCIHELHLRLIDPTQSPIAPSISSPIQWSHVGQRLPWPAKSSQVCPGIGHHNSQNAPRLKTPQAFAKKRACLGFEIKVLEKMLRINGRHSTILKRQARPAVPKVHAWIGNNIEVDPSLDRIFATTDVHATTILRSETSPHRTSSKHSSGGKPDLGGDLL